MKAIAVLFADGFEEIEAVSIVDVLRRAEFEVKMVGVAGSTATGAHGMKLAMDCTLDALDADALGSVVLPGGMPGAANLRANSAVVKLLQATASAGKPVGAICAAPMALEAAGLTSGRKITCYPGFEKDCASGTHTGERVQVDGKIVTGRGPGAGIEFGLELVKLYGKPETAEALRKGMIVK